MTHPASTATSMADWRATVIGGLPFVAASLAAVRAMPGAYGASGTIPAFVVDGRVWTLDPADTTSADDGVTVVVTSDGRRYKALLPPEVRSVVDRRSTPPTVTLSDIGKAWLIGAAPSGIWSSYADHVALYTARGWLYRPPAVGLAVHDAARAGTWTYVAAGVWLFGASGVGLVAESIAPQALIQPAGLVAIERRNAPPVSPTGVYLVDTAPSGAWAGQANRIAVGDGAGWVFRAPAEGWTVWSSRPEPSSGSRSGPGATPPRPRPCWRSGSSSPTRPRPSRAPTRSTWRPHRRPPTPSSIR